MRSLAARASTDRVALAELREIDRVDGRRVDLAAAIDGAFEDELAARLAVLAGPDAAGADVASPDAAGARSAARAILAEPRFHEPGLPRPFRGLLERAGDLLRRAVQPIARRIPGSESTLWVVLAALVLTSAFVVVALAARRRAAAELVTHARRRSGERRDPKALERRADDAARTGRFDEAVRLRFLAGLWRLDEVDAIRFRESIRSGEVARSLRVASFDGVAHRHDEIVYGDRTAGPDDDAAARDGWTRVLEEVASAWQAS